MSAFGNTGTTVLFAIMVTAASLVVISILAMSSKYTVRSRFGVFDPVINPSIPHHSLLNNPTAFERSHQPYVVYNGETFFLDDSIRATLLARRINKLDVLSNDQLEELFPFETYKNWNNGGKDDVKIRNKGILGYIDEFPDIERENTNERLEEEVRSTSNADTHNHEQDISDMKPPNALNIEMEEIQPVLHFDSGLCAICLDDLVDDDLIRGLICGHVFHKDCIDPWLTQRKCVCPTCKRDLYIKANEVEEVDVNEVIPGSLELDEILNVSQSNPYAFFLITCLTEYKAMVLLSALELVRLGVYNVPEQDRVEEQEELVQIDRRLKQFEQPLIREEGTPPRPDLTHFNKSINKIMETTPRSFNESDLHEIDQRAMEKTNRMCRGPLGYYLKWINISWDDVYYLNVIKCYEFNRSNRLNNTNNNNTV